MTRSTEVQMVLSNKGMERGVTILLTELFEKNAEMRQNLTHLSQTLDMMATMLSQVVDGAGAMRGQIEKMQGTDEDDDLPPLAS